MAAYKFELLLTLDNNIIVEYIYNYLKYFSEVLENPCDTLSIINSNFSSYMNVSKYLYLLMRYFECEMINSQIIFNKIDIKRNIPEDKTLFIKTTIEILHSLHISF